MGETIPPSSPVGECPDCCHGITGVRARYLCGPWCNLSEVEICKWSATCVGKLYQVAFCHLVDSTYKIVLGYFDWGPPVVDVNCNFESNQCLLSGGCSGIEFERY